MGKEDLSRHRDTRYVAYPVPAEYSADYFRNELLRLQLVIENLSQLNLVEIHQEIDKPRQGDVVFVDGISFDPTGQGQGVYVYIDGTYRKLTMSGPKTVAVPETDFTLSTFVPTVDSDVKVSVGETTFGLTGYAPAFSHPVV